MADYSGLLILFLVIVGIIVAAIMITLVVARLVSNWYYKRKTR